MPRSIVLFGVVVVALLLWWLLGLARVDATVVPVGEADVVGADGNTGWVEADEALSADRSAAPTLADPDDDIEQPPPAPASIRGVVVSPDLRPLPAAEVELRPWHIDLNDGASRERSTEVVHAAGDGRFEIAVSPTTVWRIVARTEGRVSTEVTAMPGDDVTLVLVPGHAVGGIVLDAGTGRGVPDATLVAWIDGSARSITTTASGEFRFDDCPAGVASLQVVADGYEPTIVEDVVTGDPRYLRPTEIRLRRGLPLRAVVRDGDTGKPIAGATVLSRTARRTGRHRIDFRDAVAESVLGTTDRRGLIEIASVARRSTRLLISAHGYAAREMPVPLSQDGTEVHELRIFAGVTAPGVVRDREGQPVVGAEVRVLQDPLAPAVTDAQGRFALVGIDGARRVVLEVTHADFALATVMGITPATDSDDPDGPFEVTLDAAIGISGVVHETDGSPAHDAIVWLEPRGTNALAIDRSRCLRPTDATGRFVFADLPPGGYALVARSRGGLAAKRELYVGPGADRALDLQLQSAGAVRGRVIDADGRPVAGATVLASSAQEVKAPHPSKFGRRRGEVEAVRWRPESWARGTIGSAQTDRQGYFVLAGFEVGPRVRLQVQRNGFDTANVVAEVAAGVEVCLQPRLTTAQLRARGLPGRPR